MWSKQGDGLPSLQIEKVLVLYPECGLLYTVMQFSKILGFEWRMQWLSFMPK